MSDNTVLNKALELGGDVVRDIDKGGFKTQVVTLDMGGAGAEQLLTGKLPVISYPANSFGDITADAWGVPKVSLPKSLFHSLFTFDIPAKLWFTYEDGVQVYASTHIASTNGAAVLTTSAAKTDLVLESRLCPRYQPNRGHLPSTALWCPDKTADGVREWGVCTNENGVLFRLKDGLLYAVLKSGGVETLEQFIDTSTVTGFDVEKGNVYDIQYQWRGVGNYFFFVNLVRVHVFANLGTLTALSMENPALPAYYRATRGTQDVAMHIGCVDIASENGDDDTEQPVNAFADAVATTGTDKPVLVVYNPLQIGGKTNTRTVILDEVSVTNTKKATFKLWRTRDLASITGATLVAIGSGSVMQTDSPDTSVGAVRATAFISTGAERLATLQVEAAAPRSKQISKRPHIAVSLVRGDYLVVTATASVGVSDVVLSWGEEI
jgi:hypothetical protein